MASFVVRMVDARGLAQSFYYLVHHVALGERPPSLSSHAPVCKPEGILALVSHSRRVAARVPESRGGTDGWG